MLEAPHHHRTLSGTELPLAPNLASPSPQVDAGAAGALSGVPMGGGSADVGFHGFVGAAADPGGLQLLAGRAYDRRPSHGRAEARRAGAGIAGGSNGCDLPSLPDDLLTSSSFDDAMGATIMSDLEKLMVGGLADGAGGGSAEGASHYSGSDSSEGSSLHGPQGQDHMAGGWGVGQLAERAGVGSQVHAHAAPSQSSSAAAIWPPSGANPWAWHAPAPGAPALPQAHAHLHSTADAQAAEPLPRISPRAASQGGGVRLGRASLETHVEHPSRSLVLRGVDGEAAVSDPELRQRLSSLGDVWSLVPHPESGYAVCSYYDSRVAKAALRELRATTWHGVPLDVRYVPTMDVVPAIDAADGAAVNHGTLVVFNLDAAVSREEVAALFSRYGEVMEVRETPKKRHHRFVEFYDVRHAAAALVGLNKAEVNGKRIKLEASRPIRRTVSDSRLVQMGGSSRPSNGSAGSDSPARLTSFGGTYGLPGGSGSGSGSRSGRSNSPPQSDRSFSTSPTAASSGAGSAAGSGVSLVQLMSSSNGSAGSDSPARLTSFGGTYGLPGGSGSGSGSRSGRSNSPPQSDRSFSTSPTAASSGAGSAAGSGVSLVQLMSSSNGQGGGADSSSGSDSGGGGGGGRLAGFHKGSRGGGTNSMNSSMLTAGAPAFLPPSRLPPGGMHSHAHTLARPAPHAGVWSADGASGPGRAQRIPTDGSAGNGVAAGGGGMGPSSRGRVAGMGGKHDGAMHGHGHSNSHTSGRHSAFYLDVQRARSGADSRTTLMLKNIPNKYTQRMLLAAIDDHAGLRGSYDFFYLPIDFKNRCNVGYAFINMVSPDKVVTFHEAFAGNRWERFHSEKVASVTYARIQGKNAMIQHFANSSLLMEDKRCRPILFTADGTAEAWPAGAAAAAHAHASTHPHMHSHMHAQAAMGQRGGGAMHAHAASSSSHARDGSYV